MISQAEFFDSCAERWDSLERKDIRTRLDRIVRALEIEPGMDILDVGTGTGVLIPSLLKAMNELGSIKAIDISQGMLRVARSKVSCDRVQFELADIESFKGPDRAYDRVICNAVFPHFTHKAMALLRIGRMLKPEGQLAISHPTGRDAVNNIHRQAGSVVAEDRVPNAKEMRVMLEAAGFVDVKVTDEPEFYLAVGVLGKKDAASEPPGSRPTGTA